MSLSVHPSSSLLSSDLSISSFIHNMDLYKCHFDWLLPLLPFNSLAMDVLQRLWSAFFIQSWLFPSDSAAMLKASCFFFLFRKSWLALSQRHLFSSTMLSNTSLASVLNVFSCVFCRISTASTSPVCTLSNAYWNKFCDGIAHKFQIKVSTCNSSFSVRVLWNEALIDWSLHWVSQS